MTDGVAMRFDAVMFDLDGTLLDTLADIAAAGNHTLRELGHEPIAQERYRYLAGQGAPYLVREALGPEHADEVERGLAIFKQFQLAHSHRFTTLYDGVAELLDALTARALPLAVLSNKPDQATREVVEQRLGRWSFAAVRGHREELPLKPDPASAKAIAQELEIRPERWLYLGDTNVDMQTATAAGMFAVGALWGFRDEPELRSSGARAIIREPGELLTLLED